MELSKLQERFINYKSSGYQLLKGKEGSGKSTSLVYKALNLENNYCLYNEDKILIVNSDHSKNNISKLLYNEEKNKEYFYSLFSLNTDRTEILSIKELISVYSEAYKRKKGLALRLISDKEEKELFNTLKEEIKDLLEPFKFYKKTSLSYIFDEVLWIKSSNLSKEEYLIADRKGRGISIKRNSSLREAIYRIQEIYNYKLLEQNLMDRYDAVLFGIFYLKSMKGMYTHIILDDTEQYTKAEIDFVRALYNEKDYSSFVLTVNTELNGKENSWLVKGRNLNSLGIDTRGRTFNYKLIIEKNKTKIVNTIEQYQYINFKNNSIIDFNIDTASNEKEILLEDNVTYNEKEIKGIPMYSNIAAGNPIEMTDNIEGDFYLPESWLERGKDVFILKVKGDSMVDRNILNGDLVVIKRQNYANHNDIVAASLDNEATLKTLKLNGEYPVLMPANNAYPAIPLEGREVTILGVVIGIIKNKNNFQ